MTETFFTPQVPHLTLEGGVEKYGCGLEFLVNPAGQVVFCGKEGINAGVSGLVRHYPKEDLNVVLLSNMENGTWEPARKIHEMMVAGLWR